MAEGTIEMLGGNGGRIQLRDGMHILFQASAVEGVRYEELHEGEKVTFVETYSPKGPRAEHIVPA